MTNKSPAVDPSKRRGLLNLVPAGACAGFHHNVFGGFLSLKVGIYSAGTGEVRARQFTYRGLRPA